ncbi:MAG TPA: aldehyde dehydrogenase, partial [Mycobacteriales bacterium]|nr:aldehyde dehydrogenase [Mycobacteriales bacterium]
GGMACVNATAVLYEGDAAPLAHAIAERLAALPDEVLPTTASSTAYALSSHLARAAADAQPVLGADQVVADRGNGRSVLRPAVHLLSTPDPARLNVELPFPCVWVAPWTRDAGMDPLRNSLVLSLVTSDDDLIDRALAEPSVVNVYVGRVSTVHSAPHIPHEGFLADFLMRNKGFVRS